MRLGRAPGEAGDTEFLAGDAIRAGEGGGVAVAQPQHPRAVPRRDVPGAAPRQAEGGAGQGRLDAQRLLGPAYAESTTPPTAMKKSNRVSKGAS